MKVWRGVSAVVTMWAVIAFFSTASPDLISKVIVGFGAIACTVCMFLLGAYSGSADTKPGDDYSDLY